MFIIPCKYHQLCKIEETVSSIRKFHPSEKILVVDSGSDDKEYFKKLEQFDVIIADINNNNYESGAFWYAIQKYKEDYYVLLHDSTVLKRDLNEQINSKKLFYSFMYFVEDTHGNHMKTDHVKFIETTNRMLGDCEKLPTDRNIRISGLFGPIFIIKGKLTCKLLEKNLHNSLLPKDKYEHQISERAFGLAIKQLGVDIMEDSLIGNFHSVFDKCFDKRGEVLYTDYIDKTWLNNFRK